MGLKPINEIKANLGLGADGEVQAFFTNTCATHIDNYIPKDIGNLRKIKDVRLDSVTYMSVYAHAQYTGKIHGSTVKNYTTPRNRSLLG